MKSKLSKKPVPLLGCRYEGSDYLPEDYGNKDAGARDVDEGKVCSMFGQKEIPPARLYGMGIARGHTHPDLRPRIDPERPRF